MLTFLHFWYILQNHFEQGCADWLPPPTSHLRGADTWILRGQAFWLVTFSGRATFLPQIMCWSSYQISCLYPTLSPNIQAWLRVQKYMILTDDLQVLSPGQMSPCCYGPFSVLVRSVGVCLNDLLSPKHWHDVCWRLSLSNLVLPKEKAEGGGGGGNKLRIWD